MPLRVQKGKQFQIATEGAHQGTLAAIVDVGEVETTYKGETKLSDVMRFIWLIDELDEETGEPLVCFQRVPKSTHERSTFGKNFKAMMGRSPVPDEDALQLLGMSATLNFEHKERDGQKYSNVVLVLKAAKGVEPVEIPADWQPPNHRKGEGETYVAGRTELNEARAAGSGGSTAATAATATTEVAEEEAGF